MNVITLSLKLDRMSCRIKLDVNQTIHEINRSITFAIGNKINPVTRSQIQKCNDYGILNLKFKETFYVKIGAEAIQKKLNVTPEILNLEKYKFVDLEEIEKYKEITTLLMRGTYICNMHRIVFFDKLVTLDISYTEIKNLNIVSLLTNIEGLYASGNSIEDLSHLKTLTNLTILYLDNNSIIDIKTLSSCKKLKILKINNNYIHNIDPLCMCTNLMDLDIENNVIQSIKYLCFCENLIELNIKGNKIKDLTCLLNCKNLSVVNFDFYKDMSIIQDYSNHWSDIYFMYRDIDKFMMEP